MEWRREKRSCPGIKGCLATGCEKRTQSAESLPSEQHSSHERISFIRSRSLVGDRGFLIPRLVICHALASHLCLPSFSPSSTPSTSSKDIPEDQIKFPIRICRCFECRKRGISVSPSVGPVLGSCLTDGKKGGHCLHGWRISACVPLFRQIADKHMIALSFIPASLCVARQRNRTSDRMDDTLESIKSSHLRLFLHLIQRSSSSSIRSLSHQEYA